MEYEIRAVVLQYLNGEIDYARFRSQFVMLFLASKGGTDEKLANQIESECADFSAGLLTEAELRSRLAGLIYAHPTIFMYGDEVRIVQWPRPIITTTSNIINGHVEMGPT